jgi:hypothetical protein
MKKEGVPGISPKDAIERFSTMTNLNPMLHSVNIDLDYDPHVALEVGYVGKLNASTDPNPPVGFELDGKYQKWIYDEADKFIRGESSVVCRRDANVIWLPSRSPAQSEGKKPSANGKLQPDYSEAERFLNLLDPSATFFTYQTFDDDQERREKRKQTDNKRDPYARIIHGTLDECWDELCRLNGQGAGIFITVNATDGKGRSKENIQRVRALFNDLDNEPLEPVLRSKQPPHIVVESSPGHFHPYRLVEDVALDQFEPLQKKLIAEFGGDNVHDLPRVLRLPGFIHRKEKDKPSLVHIVSTREGPLYNAKDFGISIGNGKDDGGSHTTNDVNYDPFQKLGWDINKTSTASSMTQR